MKVACLTGGIATGKSEFVRLFIDNQCDVAVFDCDAAVHDLLTGPQIIGRVAGVFGKGILDLKGAIDRKVLREIVFSDPAARLRLESILHPEVRRECLAARDRAALTRGVSLFLAEVPLLYESEFDVARDYEIVVAASPERQRARLCQQRGLGHEIAERMLAAQWPIFQKVQRAGIVIWNGGSFSCLKRQAQYLRKRLGLPS
jgi:dephospho-CoA kinase